METVFAVGLTLFGVFLIMLRNHMVRTKQWDECGDATFYVPAIGFGILCVAIVLAFFSIYPDGL